MHSSASSGSPPSMHPSPRCRPSTAWTSQAMLAMARATLVHPPDDVHGLFRAAENGRRMENREQSLRRTSDRRVGLLSSRRAFLTVAGAAAIAPLSLHRTRITATENTSTMYGLIGKMTAVAGQRDALASILLDSTGSMPGCLSYVIATDPADADALWITEVWDSAASHNASLALRRSRPRSRKRSRSSQGSAIEWRPCHWAATA